MTTNIRFSTVNDNVPLFTEAGLSIARGAWSVVDLDTATPEQRDMLEKHVGRIVQVHEHDAVRFLAACEPLELFDGTLRNAPGVDPASVAPIGQRHQIAAKVDAVEKQLAAEAAAAASASASDVTGDTTARGFASKKGATKS